jgi:ABC-type multidrug transport system fused ATPase/permease subunit
MRWQAFHRARRIGERAGGRGTIVAAGSLSAIFLALLVLVGGALADLLSSGGDLSVPLDEAQAAKDIAESPDQTDDTHVRYFDRGVLPLVWRMRHTPFAAAATNIYQSTGVLSNSIAALVLLIAIGWVLAIGGALAMDRLERAVQGQSLASAQRLRAEVHRQAVRLGASEMPAKDELTPTQMFVSSVEQFRQGLVAWHRVWPQAVVLLVLLVVVALAVDVWLSIAAIIYALLVWLFVSRRYAAERRREILLADRARQQESLLIEDMRQARFLANFFSVERVSGEPFDERLRRYHGVLYERESSAAAIGPSVFALIMTGVAVVLVLGGINILNDPPKASLASTLVLGGSLMASLYPLRRWERLLAIMPSANDAAAELLAFLDRRPAVGQLPDATPLPRISRAIEFQQVSLAEKQGRKLLADVSFSLAAGSRTMIFSSGPETPAIVAGLVARFFDPTSGAVLFDGQDVRRGTLASVRNQIAWIAADSLLVTGTIAENIACGEGRFSAADVIEAAKAVHAYDFIQQLPQGFETIVGEHGATLAVSETMRIGLARAALRRPTVIVLDEPATLSDVAATEALADSVGRAAAGRTLIVLARRLATLRAAERILLFHEGRLEAEGSHAELLAQSELYRHLNYVRFHEFVDASR